ncbi:hypothetical protein FHS85_004799 [Rhodoligotrophos appendicifer]|uniref:hypothetical protein n=1 Tax=Rhodoligotrophos appendicifer TaxID=987056 RepID=UPI0011850E01|nr:hypothetical protein [Rhodoligotrophos appendicifer]
MTEKTEEEVRARAMEILARPMDTYRDPAVVAAAEEWMREHQARKDEEARLESVRAAEAARRAPRQYRDPDIGRKPKVIHRGAERHEW